MKCMSLRPNDLGLVYIKAPTGDHKIADWWEATPHHVLSQLANQPVFKVQQIDAEDDANIYIYCIRTCCSMLSQSQTLSQKLMIIIHLNEGSPLDGYIF